MDRGAGDAATLGRSLILPAIYFVLFVPLFFVADLDLFPRRGQNRNELSPVLNLEVTNMEEKGYAAKHEQSYSPTLVELGPFPPKTKGYAFTYIAGPQGVDAKIKTYTLSAQPTEPCPRHCSCSFFTDQTGVVRMTEENRPATVHDPPLTPDQRSGRGAWPQM
jgi:hypothetical protein